VIDAQTSVSHYNISFMDNKNGRNQSEHVDKGFKVRFGKLGIEIFLLTKLWYL
jgi:hypothetical protein